MFSKARRDWSRIGWQVFLLLWGFYSCFDFFFLVVALVFNVWTWTVKLHFNYSYLLFVCPLVHWKMVETHFSQLLPLLSLIFCILEYVGKIFSLLADMTDSDQMMPYLCLIIKISIHWFQKIHLPADRCQTSCLLRHVCSQPIFTIKIKTFLQLSESISSVPSICLFMLPFLHSSNFYLLRWIFLL